MAATTSTAPEYGIVSKFDSVPVIHDSVSYAHDLINSYQLTAKLYGTAVGIASKGYDVASPVISRTRPILQSADGLAVATFDRAAATFPYPFTTPTEELIGVKQAKGIYDARVHPVVSEVVGKTTAINSAIGARASATVHTSQDLAHTLLAQLRQITEHGAQLPAVLLDGVAKAAADVKEILFAKETTLQDKSNNLAAYVVNQAKPVIDEIYVYVNSAKLKAEAKGDKLADAASEEASKVTDKAAKETSKATDKAAKESNKATEMATAKVDATTAKASTKATEATDKGAAKGNKTAEKISSQKPAQ